MNHHTRRTGRPLALALALALTLAALLSACGSGLADPADARAGGAALMAPANAPLPDCAADGCNQPRIVDGLAEQFRAAAIDAPAAAAPDAAAAPGQAGPLAIPAEPLSPDRAAAPLAGAPPAQ
ncbi:MAG: hypothetical protein QFF03_12480 [Pseudomonadota bacterium]|nr:hypothetical protein [Pseudomonadota bacterium]